jgi:hypothetical protein
MLNLETLAMAESMFNYDEAHMLDVLKAMPPDSRLACVAAAATRLVPACERFAALHATPGRGRARQIAAALWMGIEGKDPDPPDWRAVLNEVMGMIPGEDVEGGMLTSLAEDALASLAYAIRCLLTDDPQQAAWALGREYDAADHAAMALTGIVPKNAKQEAKILSHALVQRALGRQNQDMVLLEQGGLAELQRQAYAHPAFTEHELTAFSSVK